MACPVRAYHKGLYRPALIPFWRGAVLPHGGKKIGAVSFLQILAPELNDRILADMLDLETGVIVNLHIHSIDQTEAIKTVKRKITDLDKMKIEEQKKAVRAGYDMDIIPSDLATFGGEAKNLLQDLQSRNERMFLLTFLVVNMADTKRKLENDISRRRVLHRNITAPSPALTTNRKRGLCQASLSVRTLSPFKGD